MGIEKEKDPRRHSPRRHGSYEGRVKQLKLCRFSKDYFHFSLDFSTLFRLMKGLPESSVRRARILNVLCRAMDAHYGHEDIAGCRAILAEALDRRATESDLTAVSVGHAHIDTAWLWPIRETIRKCGRTFSSQLDLMDRYPDYIFGASQPPALCLHEKALPRSVRADKKARERGPVGTPGGHVGRG